MYMQEKKFYTLQEEYFNAKWQNSFSLKIKSLRE